MRGREWTEFWKKVMAPHPAEEKVILRCEAGLDARFPPEFREKIIQANGGLVRTGAFYWFVFPCPDRSHVLPHPIMWLGRPLKDIVSLNRVVREFDGFPRNAVAFGLRRFHNTPDGALCFVRQEDDPGLLQLQVWLWHLGGKPFKMLLPNVSQLWIDDPFRKPKPKQNWKLKPEKPEKNTEFEVFLKTRRKKLSGDTRIESQWLSVEPFPLVGERLEICDCLSTPHEDTEGYPLGSGAYDLFVKVITDAVEKRISRLRIIAPSCQPTLAESIGHVSVDGGAVSLFDVDPIVGCDPEVLMDLEDRVAGTVMKGPVKFFSFGPTRVAMIQSGYGDGTYPMFALRDGENLVGLEVEFLGSP
jgi:hypothetical protein